MRAAITVSRVETGRGAGTHRAAGPSPIPPSGSARGLVVARNHASIGIEPGSADPRSQGLTAGVHPGLADPRAEATASEADPGADE
jgi:hypothetical protein